MEKYKRDQLSLNGARKKREITNNQKSDRGGSCRATPSMVVEVNINRELICGNDRPLVGFQFHIFMTF